MRSVLSFLLVLSIHPLLALSVARAEDHGHAYVSVSGFTRPHEQGAMFTVGIPFDRTAKALADPGVAGPRSPAVVLTTGLARQAVAAAWKTAGIGSDERRLDDIVTRARWSAVLPEMRLRAIRWDNERLLSYGTDDRTSDATGANIGLEGRLTWRLDRILYAEDEPAFERIRLERQETRMRIAQRVLEALFHWQRSVVELRAATPATLEEAEAASKVAEGEAALDVLTAGWFSSRQGGRGVSKP